MTWGLASLATSVRAMYLVLIDNRATLGCFFEHQLISPPKAISISALTLTLALDLGFTLAFARVLTLALAPTLAIVFQQALHIFVTIIKSYTR